MVEGGEARTVLREVDTPFCERGGVLGVAFSGESFKGVVDAVVLIGLECDSD